MFSEDLSHLLHDNVAGEQEGDRDADHKEDVVPALLRAPGKDGNVDMEFSHGLSPAHELLVVDAEEETDGEEWKQAPVEHLRHQDYH